VYKSVKGFGPCY
jgi:hypothetical protein